MKFFMGKPLNEYEHSIDDCLSVNINPMQINIFSSD